MQGHNTRNADVMLHCYMIDGRKYCTRDCVRVFFSLSNIFLCPLLENIDFFLPG